MAQLEAQLNLDEVATLDPAEAVAGRMRQWILSGALPDGKRLPSERVLATRLGVGRAAVRKAMAVLEDERLVAAHPRKVRVVNAQPGQKSKGQTQLMKQTVALLAHAPPDQEQSDTMIQPGWAHHNHRGAVAELMRRGVGVLMLGDNALAGGRLAQLAETPPCGIAVIEEPTGLSSRAAILETFHLSSAPIAAYGDVHAWPGCDVVVSDHESGCNALTKWLIKQGCRRILRVWPSSWRDAGARPGWGDERDRGYEHAIREAHLTSVPAYFLDMIEAPYNPEGFEKRARYLAGCLAEHLLADEPVDAVLTPSDGESIVLARACEILGKQPGLDVKVAGYDNYWRDLPEHEWSGCSPAVTVDKHNAEIGRKLVRLLLKRIDSQLPSEPVQQRVQPTVVPILGDRRAGS